jgi:hypothetical protein
LTDKVAMRIFAPLTSKKYKQADLGPGIGRLLVRLREATAIPASLVDWTKGAKRCPQNTVLCLSRRSKG